MFKFLTEFGPLIAFFVGYKTGGIMNATIYMLSVSFAAITLSLILKKKINKVNFISTILLLFSGGLTLYSGSAIFIKMKPTILYLIFTAILFITGYKGKPAIKFVLGHSIKLREQDNWLQLNFRFMIFFLAMAIINELVWRNFSENAWVNFKVFGALPLTLFFTVLQLPFIMRNSIREEDIEEEA